MANFYKDEAGHFTNKENDGGPCRHKRINNGKYEYSEDEGKNWKAFNSRDEYDKYEADSWEFDENNDDDFGFDEDGDIYKEYDLNKDMISDKIFENFTLSEEIEPELVQQLMDFVDDEFGVRNVTEREQLVNDFLKEQGIKIADEKENNFKIYEDKIREELGKVRDKKSAEYVADLIDENTEAGYISDELSDKLYSELDNMIDKYVEGMPLYNSKKESSPMNEFSGPDQEGPSFAQLDANFNKGLTVDAPEKGQGWKKTKMASGILYEGPNGEREMDDSDNSQSSERKGLVKDTLVDKFDDAHLYNDGGKFQLALSDGSTKEFNSKNEAIDYLSEYSKRDYSWAKDKTEKTQQDFTNRVGKFIYSDGSDQELDSMISDLRKNMSDEDIIKKLATMFKGSIK